MPACPKNRFNRHQKYLPGFFLAMQKHITTVRDCPMLTGLMAGNLISGTVHEICTAFGIVWQEGRLLLKQFNRIIGVRSIIFSESCRRVYSIMDGPDIRNMNYSGHTVSITPRALTTDRKTFEGINNLFGHTQLISCVLFRSVNSVRGSDFWSIRAMMNSCIALVAVVTIALFSGIVKRMMLRIEAKSAWVIIYEIASEWCWLMVFSFWMRE